MTAAVGSADFAGHYSDSYGIFMPLADITYSGITGVTVVLRADMTARRRRLTIRRLMRVIEEYRGACFLSCFGLREGE